MNLVNRLIGGFLILVILIGMAFMGRLAFSIGIGIFSSIAIIEMKNALKNIGYNLPYKFALIMNLLFMIDAYVGRYDFSVLGIVVILISIFIYMIFNKTYKMQDFFALLFAVTYISLFMSNAIRIKDSIYVFMLYIIAWGSDTSAFIAGSLFGKRKITAISHISPNKTVEGFLGGIIGAVILNLIYVKYINLDKNLMVVVGFTILAAILSEVGDLVASFIKRKCDIKDYGNVIRGHGGILDRFDSVLFVSPVMFLFSIL